MSYLAKNYNRKKISFKRGKGSYLYSVTGTRYLDFVQGIAVNCLGHAHPKLIKTIKDQSKKLWHVSNAFQIPEGEKLAKKLCQKTFADYQGINLNSNYGGGSYYPETIMLYDIMALQEIYGKSSNSTGDDTYSFEKNNPPFKALYDTGGNDTLDLSSLKVFSSLY